MNFNDLITYLISPVGLVALIIALAELAKGLGLKKKWTPLLDLILGIVGGVVIFGVLQGQDMILSTIVGIALGLSACGLFSGVKNVLEK